MLAGMIPSGTLTLDRPWITVVSGLPRSGTSLMMQMLAAGGIPPLTDGQRAADPSNPRGYLEFDPVKRLKGDRSWLPQARGKAVKIIHLLLPELADASPGDYRVVMMRRPVGEVVRSQRAMLARQGKASAAVSDAQLGAAFRGPTRPCGTLAGGQTGIPGLRGALSGTGCTSGANGGEAQRFPGWQLWTNRDGAGRRSRAVPGESLMRGLRLRLAGLFPSPQFTGSGSS